MQSRRSIFGSLKSKATKPEKSAFPSSPTSNSNPFTSVPPTRRPDRPGMNAFTTPSNEPPPAYTAAPPPTTAQRQPPAAAQPTTTPAADDPYSFLSSFDTIFLIDDSGSMAGRSWRECSAALQAIAPICTAHDADGVDIVFLNAAPQPFHRNVTLPSTIHEIFTTVRPGGGTPTGQRLSSILKPYLRELERSPETTKPLNVIVITDGVPADDPESVLIDAARKLDRLEAVPWQVGVQFMQVGDEEGARQHLEGLDDELSGMGGGCRDIVDTVPMARGGVLTGEQILKAVLGAVNRRLDRRANAA